MTRVRRLVIRLLLPIAIISLALFSGVLRPGAGAASTTFTVTSTGDGGDAAPGDGFCKDGGGACTLRAAIMESNALAGADTINFSIGGGGFIATIAPTTALPFIVDPVTINGQTQCCVPVGIEIDGVSCAGCLWGLDIGATSTIKGMVINDFPAGAGIAIAGPNGGSTITSNFIGTNTTASATKANGAGVIVAASSSNSIGPGNTISGNSSIGVWITACLPAPFTGCGATDNNTITSNAIGTNGCCTFAVPNGIGVEIDGASGVTTTGNNVGVQPASGNTIAGNLGAGVKIVGASGNSVGPGPIGFSGTSAIPNGGAGVEIDGTASQGATGNVVGCSGIGCTGIGIGGNTGDGVYIHGANASGNSIIGASVGETCPGSCYTTAVPLPHGAHGVHIAGGAHDNNVINSDIGYNAGAGVAIEGGGVHNGVHGVPIHDNGGLAVDLAPVAPINTPQTVGDFAPYITPLFDTALTSALFCPNCFGAPGGLVAVTGYTRAAPPNSVLTLNGEYSDTCDPSGYGEATYPLLGIGVGDVYVPPNAVTTDAAGNVSGAGSVTDLEDWTTGGTLGAAAVGKIISITQTSPDGTTSEYTKCVTITSDTDSDGIEDSGDPSSAVFSDTFTDVPAGGTTFGTIVDRAGCYVSVVDLPPNGGTGNKGFIIGNICPHGGGPARISVCGFATITIVDGSSLEDTCDSFRSGVYVGPLHVEFGPPPYQANLPTNTHSVIADLGNDRFGVANDATSAAAITAGGFSVAPGNSITLSSVGGLGVQPAVAEPAAPLPLRAAESRSRALLVAFGLAIAFIAVVGLSHAARRRRAN